MKMRDRMIKCSHHWNKSDNEHFVGKHKVTHTSELQVQVLSLLF